MPALNQMFNVHKAKLICELFPEEIPAFLAYAKDFSDRIAAAPDDLRKQWDENPIIGPDQWLSYAAETSRIIAKYGKKLTKSPKAFADQLFDGMLSIYTRHCLHQYAEHKTTDEKFKLAHQLIF